jgi:hypothetical protein
MKTARILSIFGTLALSSGVYADVTGTKAEGLQGGEICIVGNTYTGQDFRDAYERRIRAKGYTTRIVAAKGDCTITTTYVADYGKTGWGRYLRTAMLWVHRDGEEIARVNYKGSRHGFKGKVEDVIGEMVDVLYPTPAQ